MKKYFVDSIAGRRLGPASPDEIDYWLKRGTIHAGAPVQDEAGDFIGAAGALAEQWAPAVPEIAGAPVGPSQAPAVPGAVPPPIASPFGDQYVATVRPAAPTPGEGSDYNLRAVADWQKWMWRSFAGQIVFGGISGGLSAIQGTPSLWLGLFALTISIAEIVVGIMLLRTLYYLAKCLHRTRPYLFVIAGLLPCVCLVAISQLHTQANSVLSESGVKVGYFGADMRTLP